VTFTETGLTAGAKWKVTVGKKTISSTTSSIVFNLPNGSYTFTVHAPKGTTATPSTGPLTVAGAPVSQPISFT